MVKRSTGKALIFAFALIGILKANAQAEKEVKLEVGTLITIPVCKSGNKNFTYIDLYTKTRYLATDTIKIDSATGEGLLEFFMKPGDFDAKRLPCEYGGKTYRIAALHIFDVDGNKQKRVMLLYTTDARSILWVEFDDAYENGEIQF